MSREPFRVLAVEDQEDDRRILERCMGRTGHDVDLSFARNGVEFLERLAHDDEPFRLVLLDLNMPLKDGREVLREARQDAHTVPIVVLTTSADPADVEDAYRSGANAYFIKPYDIQEFVDLLGTIVEHWRQATAPRTARGRGSDGPD